MSNPTQTYLSFDGDCGHGVDDSGCGVVDGHFRRFRGFGGATEETSDDTFHLLGAGDCDFLHFGGDDFDSGVGGFVNT